MSEKRKGSNKRTIKPFTQLKNRKRGPYKNYSKEQLEEASQNAQEGLPLRHSIVPKSTLLDQKKKVSKKDNRRLFTDKEEEMIMEFVSIARKNGICLDRRLIDGYARKVLKDPTRKISNNWFQAFCERNNLVWRKGSKLAIARYVATKDEETIDSFFIVLKKFLEVYGFEPSHIWNIDEKPFIIGDTRTRTLDIKGTKSVHVKASDSRKHVTLVSAICANGTAAPPAFISKGKNLTSELKEVQQELDKANGKLFLNEKSGFMTKSIWCEYIEFLLPFLPAGPILIILDGHTSRYSFAFAEMAAKYNLKILVIPSHTSTALQPFDLTCFGSIQVAYLNENNRTGYVATTRLEFIIRVLPIIKQQMEEKPIKAGFKRAGIWPLNENKKIFSDQYVNKIMENCDISPEMMILNDSPNETTPNQTTNTSILVNLTKTKTKRSHNNYANVILSHKDRVLNRKNKFDQSLEVLKEKYFQNELPKNFGFFIEEYSQLLIENRDLMLVLEEQKKNYNKQKRENKSKSLKEMVPEVLIKNILPWRKNSCWIDPVIFFFYNYCKDYFCEEKDL